jgi:diguanylate cyclase (GGDEF)-like protein
VARVGGDEFLLLLPGSDSTEAFHVAERLRQSIAAAPVNTANGPVGVTISCSVTELGNAENSIDDLLRLTESGLRNAKVAGRNRTAMVDRLA